MDRTASGRENGDDRHEVYDDPDSIEFHRRTPESLAAGDERWGGYGAVQETSADAPGTQTAHDRIRSRNAR